MAKFNILLLLLPALAAAFVPVSKLVSTTSVGMVPRFDPNERKWYPTSEDEERAAGYNIWGSLLRKGPLPFFNRLFKAGDYEQGVLKFMASENIDRNTAQSEMDAYLENPNDWAYNRLNGYDADYLSLEPKKIALTIVWGTFITTFMGRAALCFITGDYFWNFIKPLP